MGKKKLWRRITAVILTLVLTLTLVPAIGKTEQAYAEGEKEITGLGIGTIGDPAEPETKDTAWSGSYIYYGTYNGQPVRYRVLDSDTDRFGGNTMFLDCDTTLFKSQFRADYNAPDANQWSKSDIIKVLNTNNDSFLNTAFTAVERNAIAESTIAEHELADYVTGFARSWFGRRDESGKKYSTALNVEKIFLLDVEDILNTAYGYSDNCGYLDESGDWESVNNHKKSGSDPEWWQRSPHSKISDGACGVDFHGDVDLRTVDDKVGVSPAFNLNLSSIVFSSLISGTAGEAGAEYKLTILDKDMAISVTDGEQVTVDAEGNYTVPYTISGDNKDKANRVSVLILDHPYIPGESVTDTDKFDYIKLNTAASFSTSGTGTFRLPEKWNGKKAGVDYYIYILAEEVHTDDPTTAIDESKLTDYASSPVSLFKTITGLGTGAISNPLDATGVDANYTWQGSYVYYGNYDRDASGSFIPIRYRVLDKSTAVYNTDTDGAATRKMLLDCDSILYYMAFDSDGVANVDGHNPKEWAISDVKTNVNGAGFFNKQGVFTDSEKAAIVYSSKASAAADDGYGYTLDEIDTTPYTPLVNDRIFLLDPKEVTNTKYGFRNSTTAGGADGIAGRKSKTRLKTGVGYAWWWLRSFNDYSLDDAACVDSDGKPSITAVEASLTGVSPAFNLNLSSVIFSSLISGTAGEAGAEYKLTVKDAGLNIAVTEGAAATLDNTTKVVTVPYTVTDTSDTSTPDQVSVVITDGIWTENGWSNGANLLQYGKLTVTGTQTTGNVTTGTGAFTLDTTNVNGTWGTDYHVYILAEDVNIDNTTTATIDESKFTDYASAPVEIHVHSFTYAAGTGDSADTITATCTNGGCDFTENKVSFSIVAPQLNTYGGTESAAAGLSGADAFNSATGNNVSVTDIKYTGINGTDYPESSTPPVNAGNYRASITVDTNKSAYVDYAIAQRAVTVTAKDQTINEGGSISTGTDYVTASEGATGLLAGHYISAITLTKNEDNGLIIPSAAEIKDAAGNTVTRNYNISYVDGALTVNAAISVTVTFKVVNGSWDNETDTDKLTADKTITLTCFEGDTLKLTDGQIPVVGSKPDDTYKAGSWDTVPSTETAITADTTYTYTYTKKDSISKKVTFKVINGAWDNETAPDKVKEDIIITLNGYEGDILKLTAADIPAVGNKPNDTYKAGSWDITPSTETVITADTTYTYTYINKDSISAKVTFKVVNGSWDDGTTADKLVTLTGHEGDILKLAEGQIPSVGNKPDETYKAGSWDATPNVDAAITTDTIYTYKYAKKDSISTKVTFKVVNGAWDDGKTENVTITLSGYDGDTLKLADNQIPGVGSKPDDTYKAGSWDVVPSADTAIAADTTYTYTYVNKDSISAQVTFKVIYGSWNDGKTDDVTLNLIGHEGDALKLAATDIPAVGSKPGDTYKAGSWDVTPGTDTTFADGSTTIYTYTYAKEELTPGPSLSPEPSLSPAPSPTETPAVTTNTTPTPTPTPTPLPYTSDETKTFSDGSKMLTTKTWNEDGTYTEKSVREWKNGNKTTKEFIQDLKTEKILYSFDESITFSKLGNETIKTTVRKADGYRFNSTEKIFTSGTTKLSSTEILADKTRQEIKETRTAEGSLSRKVMDTDPEGASKLTVTVETPADKPDGTNEAVNRTVTIYNVGKDKTAELVSLKTDYESVTIPKSVYFGGTYYKVFSISDKAFRNNKTVTVVVIGKNVKTIGEKAFYGCTNLENIYVYSKQIESVGKKAFYKISKKAVFHIKAKKKICSNLARMIKDAGYKGNVKYEKIK